MRFPLNTDVYASVRRQMVDNQLRLRGIVDERVLQAMQRVPRHEFAPERFRDQAVICSGRRRLSEIGGLWDRLIRGIVGIVV